MSNVMRECPNCKTLGVYDSFSGPCCDNCGWFPGHPELDPELTRSGEAS